MLDFASPESVQDAAFDDLPVPAMAAVLLVVVGSQAAAVVKDAAMLAPVLPVYVSFMVLAPVLGALSARLFRLSAPAARVVSFSAGTRNSLVVLPLALSLPEDIRSLAAAAVIRQTMVELVAETIYLKVIPILVWKPVGTRRTWKARSGRRP